MFKKFLKIVECRFILICLSLILLLMSAGCGRSSEQIRVAVENYEVFSEENLYNMENVSDFVSVMQSFENDNVIVYIHYASDLDEDTELIKYLIDNKGFKYDKTKDYCILSAGFDAFSAKDNSLLMSYSNEYLFSVSEDGVTAEATSLSDCSSAELGEEAVKSNMIGIITLAKLYAKPLD